MLKCLVSFFLSVSSVAFAAEKISPFLVHRLAVFPFAVDEDVQEMAEKAWWSVRQELTRNKRFLVASRIFLKQKDVFKARGNLTPADAIVLSKIVDAHAVLTFKIEKQKLILTAYSGFDGATLWKDSIDLGATVPSDAKMIKESTRLIRAFIADIPYHARQVIFRPSQRLMQQEGDVQIAKIYIAKNHVVSRGSIVQWISPKPKDFKPLFQGGLHFEIIAEGEVLDIEGEHAIVEVLSRDRASEPFAEHALVRVPSEADRLRDLYGFKRTELDALVRQAGKLTAVKPEKKEEDPLGFILSFFGSLALLLVIAL